MKIIYLSLCALTLFFSGCSKKTNFPYELVGSKQEEGAEMFLYTCGDSPNTETLIAFCAEKKQEFERGAFHFIVFFDNKEDASFPIGPLTSLYISEEELSHIKAIYTYNYLNGYSELVVYHPNGWMGNPEVIQVVEKKQFTYNSVNSSR